MSGFELLNDKQKEAVLYTEGPLLIIAGPGSGKTRTLVERVLYLLNEKEAEPENILLATFTEKASRELITRVSENIKHNLNLSEMYIGTIHSICLRIIDENIEKSFLRKNYKVLDALEQRFFLYSKLKKFENIEGYENFFLGMNASNSWKKAGILQKWIDRVNEEKLGNEKIKKSSNKKIVFLNSVHEKYKELLFEENTVDFSNIQLECFRLLSENNDILENLREKIRYIMIDEYQDTNTIQEKLFLLIAGERKNICVVGDDDQGIYRFRGATVKNILHFQKNFEEGECKKIELDINYRSNEDIVNFCNLWNKQLNWDGWRYSKNIVSGKERINKTLGVIKISADLEYKWEEKLYRFIDYLKKTERITDYNQVAFLFRSVRNYRVLRLMEALEHRGIPVYSPRSEMFFQREEIKFLIGLFIMIFPQTKNLIFTKGYGIEDYYKECYEITRKIIKTDKNLIEYMKSVREKFEDEECEIKSPSFLGIFYGLISTGTESIKRYFNLTEDHIIKNRSTYNFGIFSKILSKFDDLCNIEYITKKNADKIINYFFNIHLKFLIDSGMGEYESLREYAPKGAVSFLTVHQGKGLEFPCVIVGSLEGNPTVEENEAQLKLEMALTESFEPEYRIKEFDFWRIYYTAFSRAQNLLALTCVENSYKPVPSLPFKRLYEELKDASDSDFEFAKLHFEDVKEINIKDIFAFTSHISLYNKCPRLYKLYKKYEFIPEKNKGMIFGTLVHETLEDINRKIFKKENISFEIVEEIFYENYKNIQKKYKINIEKEILKTGEESIKEYLENYSLLYDNIKDIEVKLSLVKEKYILEGIVDLVVEKDSKIEIIDFKTGKRNENEKAYINQLEIYAYLIGKKYKREIKRGKLYYLGEKENKIKEINFTEENLSNAVKDFDKTAEKILAENFQCFFEEGKSQCRLCWMKEFCKKESFKEEII
ncbi:ATP-dependent helicase [Fusobacterium perfoetens]|uniref:ATP-dependent DNA helicase n=1 Tax=Fusobacterium perfoetens TaxID=852 RepID=UPI001F396CF9|nr:ATP-dependent DNA helicase [Fusobacterium perfoetens]MCF2624618.1 ATP-dependent helicase [Fusobacterium perfoetens]